MKPNAHAALRAAASVIAVGASLGAQTIDDVRRDLREAVRGGEYIQRVVALVDFSTEPTLSGAHYEIDGEPTEIDTFKLPWRRDFLEEGDDLGLRLEAAAGWLQLDTGSFDLFGPDEPDIQTNVRGRYQAFSGTASAGPIFRLNDEFRLITVGRVSYAYLESDGDYSGVGSPLSQALFDRLLFNWSVHTFSYGFGVELNHQTPLSETVSLESRVRFDASWTETIEETDAAQKVAIDTQRAAFRADLVGPAFDWEAFGAPLDYRVHAGYAVFDNDTGEALGFQDIFEIGTGLEANAAEWGLEPLSRVSLGVSVLFGENVFGYTIGGSISF